MGVLQVRSPAGETWWVKRAWVPRYRGLRDRVGAYLESRPRRWYQAPLRLYVHGRARDALDVPDPTVFVSLPDPAPGPTPPDLVGDGATTDLWGIDVGGGSADGLDLASAAATSFDVGGGGDLGAAVADGSSLVDLGGSGGAASGGGGGLDLDLDDLAVVALVVVGVVAVLLVGWFFVLPLLLAAVDGAVLLAAILGAGAVRLLLGRPWDVVAVQDLGDRGSLVMRWELRGYRRAGRARDDVARALETGTDVDLAVARVVAREPHRDDPNGIARSVRELHPR